MATVQIFDLANRAPAQLLQISDLTRSHCISKKFAEKYNHKQLWVWSIRKNNYVGVAMQFIDSAQNRRFKQWKKLLTLKERKQQKKFVVEGFHLIEEALKAGVVFELVLGELADMPVTWDVKNIPTFRMSEQLAKQLSETVTSQNVFAICHNREVKVDWSDIDSALVVDNVQDPGNLGTLIRTADAAGVQAVVLGQGCADVHNGKVLRGTQGSIFHLPIITGVDLQQEIPALKAAGITVFGTAITNGKSVFALNKPGKFALVVGNEGSGVTEEVLTIADENLYVPIHGQAESLNVAVATGVLLYQLLNN